MSIAGLSSNSITNWRQQQQQNPFQQIKQDFKQLASALQSGDLSNAQSAYSSIQKILQGDQSSSSSESSSNGSSALQSDFATLGQALQSGDLSQAQSAFSQLQNDYQVGSQSGADGAATPSEAQDQYVSSQTQDPAQQARQDYNQLAGALQSGSLSGAQSAFAALQQLVQNQDGSNTTSSTNSASGSDAIANDFSALGQALSSGNLTQAQGAFSQLQSAVQAAEQPGALQAQNSTAASGTQVQGHPRHHHHGGGGYGSQSSTSTASTDGSGASPASSGVSLYA
jgi:DNA-binding FadR family transcriptional regulator